MKRSAIKDISKQLRFYFGEHFIASFLFWKSYFIFIKVTSYKIHTLGHPGFDRLA